MAYPRPVFQDRIIAMAAPGGNHERTPEEIRHQVMRPFLTSVDHPHIWRIMLVLQRKITQDGDLAHLLDSASAWDYLLQSAVANPKDSVLGAKLLGLAQVRSYYCKNLVLNPKIIFNTKFF